MALPKFFLLKSNVNNKYLRYVKDQANQAYLRFCYQVNDNATGAGENTNFSPLHHRFEVEKSKYLPDLVHIRSCYNNKYWMRKSAPSNYIAAEAHEAEEDQSKSSCTLFKPILKETYMEDAFPTCKAHKIQLLHVCDATGPRKLRTFATLDDPKISYLAVGEDDDKEEEDLGFTAIDMTDSATLPDRVTFMGQNDKYSNNDYKWWRGTRLSFDKSVAIGEHGVYNRAVHVNEHSPHIYLQDREERYSWMEQNNGFVAMSLGDRSFYTPVKINDDYTALRCYDPKDPGLLKYIGSDSNNDLKAMKFGESCKLRVGEPVVTREILSEPIYDTKDGRIFNTRKIDVFRDTRSNYTDIEQDGTFQVKYTTQRSMKWTQSTTVNIGVTFSLSFGIPTIVSTGEVGVDFGISKTLTWDEEVTNTSEITYTQTVKIPAKKKVTLKVVANRGSCNVPFTCRVHDVMTDGSVMEYEKNDGVYYGCNDFDFDTEILVEDLPLP